mmetsp:Transcript_49391/g.152335  ORF Transcript_49391/g.152335 Transcript_49391/m.152335 type:complete len:218 (+) Transcript_49391:393-1046(+)
MRVQVLVEGQQGALHDEHRHARGVGHATPHATLHVKEEQHCHDWRPGNPEKTAQEACNQRHGDEGGRCPQAPLFQVPARSGTVTLGAISQELARRDGEESHAQRALRPRGAPEVLEEHGTRGHRQEHGRAEQSEQSPTEVLPQDEQLQNAAGSVLDHNVAHRCLKSAAGDTEDRGQLPRDLVEHCGAKAERGARELRDEGRREGHCDQEAAIAVHAQ